MAISRVEIKNFLVFKGEFVADFCPGINVLIGGNGTGKTTLLKELHLNIRAINYHKTLPDVPGKIIFDSKQIDLKIDEVRVISETADIARTVYIPEKDILEHAKGLLTFIEQKDTGFDFIYRDVLVAAQDIPTKQQTKTQRSIGQKISDIIGGEVEWDKNDGSFYTVKTNGTRIPFSNEASGFKKLGFLGLLVTCGQLESGSVLFWDEPENSLNPELVPSLVEILLDLAKNGVQIFIATHDYNLARYFDVRKDKAVPVLYLNLSKKNDGQVVCKSSPDYIKLPDNHLERASADLFKAVVSDAMEVQDDE